MTADEFRAIALSFPLSEEAGHMGHPDFRVQGRIFATLGYPNSGWGVVKLTPVQQAAFVLAEPRAFRPVNGAWGRRGSTGVILRAVTQAAACEALLEAWRNRAPKRLVRATALRGTERSTG